MNKQIEGKNGWINKYMSTKWKNKRTKNRPNELTNNEGTETKELINVGLKDQKKKEQIFIF